MESDSSSVERTLREEAGVGSPLLQISNSQVRTVLADSAAGWLAASSGLCC